MCGRFVQDERYYKNRFPKWQQMVIDLNRTNIVTLPHYNMTRTDNVAAVYEDHSVQKRILRGMHWWFQPSENTEIVHKWDYPMYNARDDKIMQRKNYRIAFTHQQRCIIPVRGFYEWDQNSKAPKDKYYACHKNNEPLYLAGLYNKNPLIQEDFMSCSVITTEPNDTMRTIHNRMPVIVDEHDIDDWLNPNYDDMEELLQICKPYSKNYMTMYKVNTQSQNSPTAIEPIYTQDGNDRLF